MTSRQPKEAVHWLPDADYKKAVGQLRRQVYGVFDFLKVDDKLPIKYIYGTEIFVHGAVEEIVRLAEDFGLRVRGVDKVMALDLIRRKNGRSVS